MGRRSSEMRPHRRTPGPPVFCAARVMPDACHGLFFREGMVLAEEITKSLSLGEDPLEVGKQTIIDRGWAEDVLFTDAGVRVRGSIEATAGGEVETCHRLRGILSKLL